MKAEEEQSICSRDVGEEWTDYSPWHASTLKLQVKELRGFPLGDHQTKPLLQTLKDAELERHTTHVVPSSDGESALMCGIILLICTSAHCYKNLWQV